MVGGGPVRSGGGGSDVVAGAVGPGEGEPARVFA